MKLLSTNNVFPYLEGSFWNGNAIKFPYPPLGNVSWFGNIRSNDEIERLLISIVFDSNKLPNFLAVIAFIFLSKNIHIWMPLPDLLRSIAIGILYLSQILANASTSLLISLLVFLLSKSNDKK